MGEYLPGVNGIETVIWNESRHVGISYQVNNLIPGGVQHMYERLQSQNVCTH